MVGNCETLRNLIKSQHLKAKNFISVKEMFQEMLLQRNEMKSQSLLQFMQVKTLLDTVTHFA